MRGKLEIIFMIRVFLRITPVNELNEKMSAFSSDLLKANA